MQRHDGMRKAFVAMALVGGAIPASTYLTGAPMATQTIRYLGTTVVLFAIAGMRGRRSTGWRVRRPRGAEWLWLAAAATYGLTLYNLALIKALEHAEPSLVATIVAGVPVVLAVAAPLAARRRPAMRIVVGAAITVAGSALVFGAGRGDRLGVVLAVVALAGECAFTMCGAPIVERIGAVSIATHTAWIAAVQLGVLTLLTDRSSLAHAVGMSSTLAIAYLVAASAAAFVLWFDAVERIGAAVAGLAAGVIPIAALLSGIVLGVASATPVAVAGIGLVVAGLAVALRARPAGDGLLADGDVGLGVEEVQVLDGDDDLDLVVDRHL